MATKEDDKIPGTYEAPNSKAVGAKTEAGKNGSKEVARPKDETGPYVPDKRSYFAGLALTGIMANAALHRSPNAAALAVKAGDEMLDELAKPPQPSDAELTERARVENELKAQKQREQREAEAEAQAKVAEEREKEEAKEREKLEKAEREERDRLAKEVDKQMARDRDKPGSHATA